jgi:hypothetical protein
MITQMPWGIYFFRRHVEDDAQQAVPGREFLDRCSDAIAAKLLAVVKAVADGPPPQFSGGGKWEAMHDEMRGIFEVRVDGPKRHHYRLFCVLERTGTDVGLDGPSLVIISGLDKPFRTTLTAADYRRVKRLADEFRARNPRSVQQA